MASDEYPNIQAIQDDLQSEWAERDLMIDEMRQLRFMETAIDVPVGMETEIVKSPIAHQIVERMVGTLTADPLTISVPPGSEQAKAQEQSSVMEKFALAAVNQLEKQGDEDVVDKFVETLIADGHGCLRMLYAAQLWGGFPRRNRKGQEPEADYSQRAEEWKRGKPLPIAWTYCDPQTVYPMWGDYGLYGILEVDERQVLTLDSQRQKWNAEKPDLERLSRSKGKTGSSVTFQQWWTPDSLTYAVEGQVVHHTKHRYGTPPYAYALGLSTASRDPKYMALSVLYPVRHLIPYLDRVLSQKASAVRMWCWPTVIFKQLIQQVLNPDGTSVPREIEITPGKMVTLYENEDIGFLTWQGNGPDADEMIQLVTNMIERAGLADSMYGQSKGDSGYAINQLIAAARMRYKPIVAHAERALESQICCLYDIIEYQLKQVLHVYSYGKTGGWISLGPDDLKGYRQVKVSLNPLMPTDTYARSSQALNEVRGGLRSRSSGMEMIGIEQPDEEMREILRDGWRARPEVAQFMAAEAVKRAGLKLAQGGLGMSKLQGAYPELAPSFQQFITGQLNAVAPAGQTAEGIGMAPAGQVAQGMGTALGQGAQGIGVAPQQTAQPLGGVPGQGAQATPQLSPQLMQAIQMLAQKLGVQPQVLLQQLIAYAQQKGIPLETLVQMLLQQVMGGQQQGAPQPQGMPQGTAVMAAPGVQAAPAPPRVGPVVRPSGIATGRAPGTRRRGAE